MHTKRGCTKRDVCIKGEILCIKERDIYQEERIVYIKEKDIYQEESERIICIKGENMYKRDGWMHQRCYMYQEERICIKEVDGYPTSPLPLAVWGTYPHAVEWHCQKLTLFSCKQSTNSKTLPLQQQHCCSNCATLH